MINRTNILHVFFLGIITLLVVELGITQANLDCAKTNYNTYCSQEMSKHDVSKILDIPIRDSLINKLSKSISEIDQ